jgi:hypothetical protein
MSKKITVSIQAVLHCSLERAFKSPMLCDVARVHTGYGLMPKITHTEEDVTWGQVGSSKKVFAEKSLSFGGGFVSMDHVVERVENKYWVIRVDQFQSWMLGFYQFEGRWETTPLDDNRIHITYTYDLYYTSSWLYPLNLAFAHFFWKKYMVKVMHNIERLIDEEAPYLYP